MPRKRKGTPAASNEILEALLLLQDKFQLICKDYEKSISLNCKDACTKIHKLYDEKMNAIPQEMRDMTIAQILEKQEKEKVPKLPKPNITNANCRVDFIRSSFLKSRVESERKKTGKKEFRKRSVSVDISNRVQSGLTQPRMSRTISDSAMRGQGMVTPKFDPRFPMTKMARKPKPGEILMSLSGSPLHNPNNETKVTLSLGGGKVITFDEQEDMEVPSDIDESVKEKLKCVKEKLDEILKKTK